MHELMIREDTVVDGSGARPRPAAVAVDDGRIVEVAFEHGSHNGTMAGALARA